MIIQLTWTHIILMIIWAILAFLIQPYYITLRISAKYKDKEWVIANLKLSHETLTQHINKTFIPALGTLFNETLKEHFGIVIPDIEEMTKEVVSNHLKTFKASLLHPVQAEAGRYEDEITEGIANEIERAVESEAALPPGLVKVVQNHVKEKHPLAAELVPYAPGLIQKFLNQQPGTGQSGNSPHIHKARPGQFRQDY